MKLQEFPLKPNHSFCSNRLSERSVASLKVTGHNWQRKQKAQFVSWGPSEVLLHSYIPPIDSTAAGGQPSCYRDVKMRGFISAVDCNLRTSQKIEKNDFAIGWFCHCTFSNTNSTLSGCKNVGNIIHLKDFSHSFCTEGEMLKLRISSYLTWCCFLRAMCLNQAGKKAVSLQLWQLKPHLFFNHKHINEKKLTPAEKGGERGIAALCGADIRWPNVFAFPLSLLD